MGFVASAVPAGIHGDYRKRIFQGTDVAASMPSLSRYPEAVKQNQRGAVSFDVEVNPAPLISCKRNCLMPRCYLVGGVMSSSHRVSWFGTNSGYRMLTRSFNSRSTL